MSVLVPYHSMVTFVACYILYLEIKVLFYLLIFLVNYQYSFFQVNLRTCCSYLLLHNKPLQIQWLRTVILLVLTICGSCIQSGLAGNYVPHDIDQSRLVVFTCVLVYSEGSKIKLNSHVRQLRGDELEGRIIQALSFSI